MISYSSDKIKNAAFGVAIVIFFTMAAMAISSMGSIQAAGLSPVVVGMILGMISGNLFYENIPDSWRVGFLFCIKYVLRAAIIFYGFRITFQEISLVGIHGLLVSVLMVTSTLFIGLFIGRKLKIDRDLSLLTSSGSAVCGAAAVLATESVLKSEPHKSAIAVSTVVLFGTLSMFIYPVIFHSGITNISADDFGIYIGGCVHEVAQVVVAGNGVSESAAHTGVIVKMTRVMLLVPMLFGMSIFLRSKSLSANSEKRKITVPYFVFGFILVVGFNSFGMISKNGIDMINTADTFLLTMAMFALGIQTRFSKIKEGEAKAIYLAVLLFVWLIVGGYFVTKGVVTFF